MFLDESALIRSQLHAFALDDKVSQLGHMSSFMQGTFELESIDDIFDSTVEIVFPSTGCAAVNIRTDA